MAGIGQYLRKAREDLGYSLEDMNKVTNIHTEYLQALEEERFEILPSSFYARAFLRTYAKSLSLEVNPLLELYEQMTQPKQPSLPNHNPEQLSRNSVQEGTSIRMRPTLLPPPDRFETISSKGGSSEQLSPSTGSLLKTDSVHSREISKQPIDQKSTQKLDRELESTSPVANKSPLSPLQASNSNKKNLSPRRVAMEAKQGATTNREKENKKVPKLAIAIAIGALLLVGGGTFAVYNSNTPQTNQTVNKKDSNSSQSADATAPNLSLNAGGQQLPYLEEGETSSSELEGQLYYINNVDKLDVVLKGKNGESVVQYGPDSSSREQKTLRVGQTLKLDVSGKDQIWFRLTTPSNVEVMVNGQNINTMAQDTDKSYRIQVKNKK